jgi:hypothetical protein
VEHFSFWRLIWQTKYPELIVYSKGSEITEEKFYSDLGEIVSELDKFKESNSFKILDFDKVNFDKTGNYKITIVTTTNDV